MLFKMLLIFLFIGKKKKKKWFCGKSKWAKKVIKCWEDIRLLDLW